MISRAIFIVALAWGVLALVVIAQVKFFPTKRDIRRGLHKAPLQRNPWIILEALVAIALVAKLVGL
jgi:hypothetical protein